MTQNINIPKFIEHPGHFTPFVDGYVVVVIGAGAPSLIHTGPDALEHAHKEAERLIGGLPTTKTQAALVLRVERLLVREKPTVPPVRPIYFRVSDVPKSDHTPPAAIFPSDQVGQHVAWAKPYSPF